MLELINSIEDCLDKKAYLGALSLALTIPDVCGQIEYPGEENVGKRYRKWFDKYIFKYENPKPLKKWMVKNRFDGFVCYQLRNSFFHNAEIGKDVIDQLKIKYKVNGEIKFNLIVAEDETFSAGSISLSESNGISDLTMNINVETFCKKLVALAKYFHEQHEDEFNKNAVIITFNKKSHLN